MTTTDQPGSFDADTSAALLVDEVVAALVNSRIYANTHPRVQNSLSAVRRSVQDLARAAGGEAVQVTCADGMIVYRQRPLLGASIGASRLIDLLQQWRSGGIWFGPGVETQELDELFTMLAARPRPGADYTQLNDDLVSHGCRNVALLPPYVEGSSKDGAAAADEAPATATARVGLKFYQAVIDLLENVTVSVCRGGRIDFAPVQAHAERLLKQLSTQDQPLLGLARQDQYDAFTFGHSVRVAVLAMVFAKQLTEDRDLVVRIGVAALLHDVGKALIPFEILHSHRRLTPEEFEVMRKHPQYGAELLLDHHDSDPLAIAAAFGHHYTGDARGYPMTLHEHHSTLVTEIVKICDVYEALTAARPYKRPMSPVKAYRVMMTMTGKFDSALLRRFIEINGVFPIGQPVALSTGELAVVRRQGSAAMTPIVEVVTDTFGCELEDDERQIIDLADVECCAARSILGEAQPEAAEQVLQAIVTSR